MKHFIVIDMQEDFVDGALANPEAKAIIPVIEQKLREAKANGDNIIFTRDTHYENYMNTLEGKYLPVPHCIEGTPGHSIVHELLPYVDEHVTVINKNAFGYAHWADYVKPGDEVTLCGTVTSICVVSNAIMLKAIGEVDVNIIANGCAGLNKEDHEAALLTMKCCQCKII